MTSKILQYLTPQEQTQIIDSFELFYSVAKVVTLCNFFLNQKGLTKEIDYRQARKLIQELKPQAWSKYLDLQKKKQELKDAPMQTLKEIVKEPEKEEGKKPIREGCYPPWLDENNWIKEESDNPFQRKSRMRKLLEMTNEGRAAESIHIPDEETC
jgi:hypothetical protein